MRRAQKRWNKGSGQETGTAEITGRVSVSQRAGPGTNRLVGGMNSWPKTSGMSRAGLDALKGWVGEGAGAARQHRIASQGQQAAQVGWEIREGSGSSPRTDCPAARTTQAARINNCWIQPKFISWAFF
jgi:hypothetical protein